MGELLPAAAGARRCSRAATTSASTSTPRKPTGSSSRSTCSSALCAEPDARRLERHRLRRPGLPEALPARDRLPDRPRAPHRPPADGAAGQGRLLGQRDQARAGRRARRLPGLHAQGPHRRLLPRLRAKLLAAPDAVYPQFATPQRAHARRRSTLAGAGDRRPVRVPVPARHGRAALRRRSSGTRRASSAGRAASTRRSARTRRCSPTSCAACSRTAPTPRSSTASPIRRSPIDELVADPVARGAPTATTARRAAASAHPAAARALSARPPQLARASISPTKRRCARSRGARREPRRARAAAPLLARCDAAPRGRASRCAIPRDRDDVVGTVVEATPSDVDAALAAPRRRRRAGRDAPATSARPMPRARRRPAGSATMPRCMALAVREAGKTSAERDRRSARGGRLPALLRRAGARASFATATHRRSARSSASAPGTSRWRSSPARSRGARRRQPGARQAGRADAADRRAKPCACCTRPACRADALQLLPGRGETVGAALVADPRDRGRDVHRLDRGRAAHPAHACARLARADDPVR